MIDEAPSLLDSALMYAQLRGWRIFPAVAKRPRITGWKEKATTDEATIRKWWKMWPDANIGLAAGPGSGVWVLDIDLKDGKDGFKTLAKLEAQYGPLPATTTQRSGSGQGGEHRIFTWPDDGVGQTTEGLPGLDTRSDGGLIILDPSVHDKTGLRYKMIDGRPPVAAPDWLVSLFPTKEKKRERSGNDRKVILWESEGHARAYVEKAVEAEFADLSGMTPGEEKGRHGRFYNAVANIASIAVAAGYPEAKARSRIMEAAKACGLAAVEGDGLDRTYGDAWAAGVSDPRPAKFVDPFIQIEKVVPSNGGGKPDLRVVPADGGSAQPDEEIDPDHAHTTDVESDPDDSDGGEFLEGKVLDHFPSAPLPPGTVFPYNWGTNRRGMLIFAQEKTDKEGNVTSTEYSQVAAAPIFISSMDYEVNEGVYIAELTWPHRRNREWRRCRVRRDIIATSGKVPETAAYGAPATSYNSKRLVHWFDNFAAANLYTIPERRVSSRLGWHQNDRVPAGFLFGDQWIGDRNWEIQLEPVGGLGQIAEAMRPTGDIAKERASIHVAMNYPAVAAVVGASLAAPLLRILKCPGFVVSLSGTTSTGKTSAMRVAAAIWGDPDERESASVMQSWDATKRGIIEFATGMDGVPLLLDDTQRADSDRTVQAVLYGVPSGKGRLRASRNAGQTQQVNSSRTVLITSGEIPVLESSQHGGTRARVLEIWGEPWGKFDAKTGILIRDIGYQLAENHGNIGAAWVRFIVENRSQWPEWRKQYRARAREIGDELLHRWGERYAAVTGRLAEYIAVVDAALKMATKNAIIGAHDGVAGAVSEAFHCHAITEAIKKDTTAEALRYTWDISRSRLHEFVRGPEAASSRDAPSRGWLGRWDEVGDEIIYFYPARLRELLAEGGWSPEAVIRAWSARGWLDAERDRNQKKVKILSKASWAIGIDLRVDEVRELLGLDRGFSGDT